MSLRLGTTALAAVIVLPATPVAAQAMEPAAAAPVIEAPPAPAVTSPVADSAVVQQGTAEPATPSAAAAPAAVTPAFIGATRSTPIYHQPDPADLRDEGTRVSSTATIRRTAAVTRTAETRSAAPVATATRAPAEIASATAPAAAPRVAVAPTAPAVASTPVSADATGRTTPNNDVNDDVLPVAGAGAAALLLVGGGLALFRRRRRDEEVPDDGYGLRPTEGDAVPASTFAAAAAPVESRREEHGPNALPSGFDLARFGRHTQAAYRGPTPENPSHSLSKRLKRASFFDGRERMAIAAGAPAPATSSAAARTSAAVHDDGQIVVRPGTAKPRNFFRPAFSS